MASTTASTHLPPIATSSRREVGNILQATLVGPIDLALVGKQLHWSVVGPLFRPLHLQLDELVESWREHADAVAERRSPSAARPTVRQRRWQLGAARRDRARGDRRSGRRP
jgi:DNA-binding ferritin-like protein